MFRCSMHGLILANLYQRTKFVSCTTVELFQVETIMTWKSRITRDHRSWYHSKDFLLFPVSVL